MKLLVFVVGLLALVLSGVFILLGVWSIPDRFWALVLWIIVLVLYVGWVEWDLFTTKRRP